LRHRGSVLLGGWIRCCAARHPPRARARRHRAAPVRLGRAGAAAGRALQVVAQGLLAGVLAIYLFARSVSLLGASRASTFPALVPAFGIVIGYLALGEIPTVYQLAGLAVVALGFRLALKHSYAVLQLVWRFRSPHHSCSESEMRTSEPKPH